MIKVNDIDIDEPLNPYFAKSVNEFKLTNPANFKINKLKAKQSDPQVKSGDWTAIRRQYGQMPLHRLIVRSNFNQLVSAIDACK